MLAGWDLRRCSLSCQGRECEHAEISVSERYEDWDNNTASQASCQASSLSNPTPPRSSAASKVQYVKKATRMRSSPLSLPSTSSHLKSHAARTREIPDKQYCTQAKSQYPEPATFLDRPVPDRTPNAQGLDRQRQMQGQSSPARAKCCTNECGRCLTEVRCWLGNTRCDTWSTAAR